jgi:hypothetical protein
MTESIQVQWIPALNEYTGVVEQVWMGDGQFDVPGITAVPVGGGLFDRFWQYNEAKVDYPTALTAFNRFPDTFAVLEEQLEQRHEAGQQGLRVLDCPCSVGLEPLTLVARALGAGFDLKDVEVVAIDRDEGVLQYDGPFWARLVNNSRYSTLSVDFPRLTVPADMDKSEKPYDDNSPLILQLARVAVFPKTGLVSTEGTFLFPVMPKPEVVERIRPVLGDVRSLGATLEASGITPGFDVVMITNINPSKGAEIDPGALGLLNPGGLLVCEPDKSYSKEFLARQSGLTAINIPRPYVPAIFQVA